MMRIDNLQPRIRFRSREFNLDDLGLMVVSFKTSKSIDDGAGTFHVNLVGGNNTRLPFSLHHTFETAYKRAHLNDVVTLEMGIPLVTGLIDYLTRYGSFSKSGINKGITIAGRDFGSLLVDDALGVVQAAISNNKPSNDAEISRLKSVLGEDHPILKTPFTQRAPGGTFLSKSVREAVEFVFNDLTSVQTPILVDGREISALDFFELEIEAWEGDVIGAPYINNTYQGSVLNFLHTLIDTDFYEIFVDTYPGVGENGNVGYPVLRVRPKPFSNAADPYAGGHDDWNKATNWIDAEDFHTVTGSDIIDFNAGVSKNPIASVFHVERQREIYSSAEFRNNGLFFPIIDARLLKKYGFRLNQATSAMIEEKLYFERLFEKRNRFFSWHRYNEKYESGKATLRGNPRIRVGDRIHFADEYTKNGYPGILAYITAIEHDYDLNRTDSPKFTTSVTFERGHHPEEYLAYLKATEGGILEVNTGEAKVVQAYDDGYEYRDLV